ncbi:TPA: metallopeptidase TldD-related protein [Staphylococcus aureus]
MIVEFKENLWDNKIIFINTTYIFNGVDWIIDKEEIIQKIMKISDNNVVFHTLDSSENYGIEDICNKDVVTSKYLANYINDIEKKYNVKIELILERKSKHLYSFKDKSFKKDETYYIFSFNIIYNNKSIINDYFVINYIKDIKKKIDRMTEYLENYFLEKEHIKDIYKKNIKFNSESTGFFFHEFVGHFLEEDFYYKSPLCNKKKEPFFPENLNIIENYLITNKVQDDMNDVVEKNIHLIENGKIKNVLSTHLSSTLYNNKKISGNTVITSDKTCLHPRMNHMYVYNSCKKEITYDIDLYIDKISMGEVNTFTGDFSIEVISSYSIKDKEKKSYYPFMLNFNILDMINYKIDLNDDYETYENLCFKSGSVCKVRYTCPSLILNLKSGENCNENNNIL